MHKPTIIAKLHEYDSGGTPFQKVVRRNDVITSMGKSKTELIPRE